MRAAAAIPAVGVLAGSALGLLAPNLPGNAAKGAFVGASLAAVLSWSFARPRVLAATAALAFAAGGASLATAAWQDASHSPIEARFALVAAAERQRATSEGRSIPVDDEAVATIEGLLRADATPAAAGVSLSLDVDGIAGLDDQTAGHGLVATSGGVLVTVTGSLAAGLSESWRAGRRLRLPVALRRPARYLDPGVADGRVALARKGIVLTGTTKSAALVEVVEPGRFVDERIAAIRAFARRAIAAHVGRWSGRSAGIVAAIVIGDRTGLDPSVQRDLQDAGTYHVIAISGGNIAILAGLMLGAFRVAGFLGRTAMIAAIAVLLFYERFVGGGASVDRATLMATVYFAARVFDHRSDPLNAVALVAGVLVAADPLSLTDPGFLLTFGATFAILAIAALARGRVPSWAEPAAALFAASAATEALLLPIAAFVFSRVTFAGLALNFAAIPLMAVAQLAGMALVPLALFSSASASAAGWVAHIGAEGLVLSAGLVHFTPQLVFRVATPPVAVCVAYYVALLLAWWAHGTARWAAAVVFCASALWIVVDPLSLVARYGDGRLHMTFIDVGQGDAALIRFPAGRTLLVDSGGVPGGGSFDIGDRVVGPVLRSAHLYRLDYLALTHGDPDHVGGAAAVVDQFRPGEVWEGIPVPRFAPLTALRMETQRARLRWANVYAGNRIAVDGVEIRALHPEPAEWERQKVRNDDSLVLEITWRDVSFLLTGDIGKAVEGEVAGRVAHVPLRVVKVPHHGSLTSSTEQFVAATHPVVAVVSVGRANHFGHPAAAVLDRYRAAGAAILRTDLDGAVTVDTDGRSIAVRGYTGRAFTR